jgi:hypothetical protein
VGFEHLAAVVASRTQPVDLLLQSTPDLRLGAEGEHTVVAAKEERYVVVIQQPAEAVLGPSAARLEDLEVRAEPTPQVVALHARAP